MRDCPACGMPLSSATFGAVTVDGCHRCGGVWFDRGELTELAAGDPSRFEDLDRTFQERPEDTLASASLAPCPRCGATLTAAPAFQALALELRHCPERHGFWLQEPGFAVILHELNPTQRMVLEGAETIQRRFDHALHLLKRLGGPRRGRLHSDAAIAGLRHLLKAVDAKAVDECEEELRLSEQAFDVILAIPPPGEPGQASEDSDDTLLQAIAHWGKFHGANLRGDRERAALQVYECTARFPLAGVRLFPPEYFRRNYAVLLDQIAMKRDAPWQRPAAVGLHSLWGGLMFWTECLLAFLVREFCTTYWGDVTFRDRAQEVERLALQAARESRARKRELLATELREPAEVIPAGPPHGTGAEPASWGGRVRG